MALFPFFKQRTPRGFDHKPIYWDPDKEKLQRRIEEVRCKLQEAGELSPDGADLTAKDSPEEIRSYDTAYRIRGSFIESTSHTKRRLQLRAAGKGDRTSRVVKTSIGLIAAIAIVWILRSHFNVFI